jgi:hypothetical protein
VHAYLEANRDRWHRCAKVVARVRALLTYNRRLEGYEVDVSQGGKPFLIAGSFGRDTRPVQGGVVRSLAAATFELDAASAEKA